MNGDSCANDDCGSLDPVDPEYPDDGKVGPAPGGDGATLLEPREDAYGSGFAAGYSEGWHDAVDKYEGDEAPSEMELTFSTADLILMGVAFVALLIPLGFLASRTERPRWKPPWS